MPEPIKLKVADTVFAISAWNSEPLSWIKENYKKFLSESPGTFRISLQPSLRRHGVSKTAVGLGQNWKGGVFFYQTKRFDAGIDFSNRCASVYVDSVFGIVDVVRFVVSAALIKKKGFLLHAACCSMQHAACRHNGGAVVFAGASGSGKNTIARLAQERAVLTDETSAVMKKGSGYLVYATPFAGEYGQVKRNTQAALEAVFFIRKSGRFTHRLISPGAAAGELLRNCILDFRDSRMNDDLLSSVDDFSHTVPCYVLGVRPSPRIWRYLDACIRENHP